MPFPIALCLTFAAGAGAALAAQPELRVSPRPALGTRSFAAFAVFVGLVLIPVSVYFYAFHGDWFLLYWVDSQRIPSAVALVGFVAQAALGLAGFVFCASLVRTQREAKAWASLLAACVLAIIAVVTALGRLSAVGTYAQYHGKFGLVPYFQSAVAVGALVMGGAVACGLGFLLVRLQMSAFRH